MRPESRNAEGAALGIGVAGLVFMLLVIAGPAVTAKGPVAEVPFGDAARADAPRLSPAIPEPEHTTQEKAQPGGALTRTLVKGAKNLLQVAESALGDDEAGGVAAGGAGTLQTIALVADLVVR